MTLGYEHQYILPGERLARRTSLARLGTPPAGLDTAADCRRAGCHTGLGQQMAHPCPQSRRQCLAAQESQRPALAPEHRAACPIGRLAVPRRRSLRLPWCGLDTWACRHPDQAYLWRELSRLACRSYPQSAALQSPTADPTCQAAQRAGHPRVARARCTSPQKKAVAERRTLVFVDEAGFYLLPSVVRTYAPVGQTPLLPETLTRDH